MALGPFPSKKMDKLKNWFDTYTHGFDSDDPMVQEGMDLKRDHTLRVCENILDIGRSLCLCSDDLHLAETIALLHDIGRFEQYRRYKTFSDYQSEDHAALGITIIRNQGLLSGFYPETAEIIFYTVKHHNRFALPDETNKRPLFFLKMLRDADKADILRVMTDYYLTAGNTRNPAISLNLPDNPEISDKIHEDLCRGRPADTRDVKTLNDLKLLQMGWVFDLNFPRTFGLIHEKGYLEKLRHTLPRQSRRVAEIYTKASNYLGQNAVKRVACQSPEPEFM